MNDSEKIQLLMDRIDVGELIHRYPVSIDSRNWPLFQSIFTERIKVCLGPAAREAKYREVTAAAFTQDVTRIISQFAITQHFLTDYHVEVNRDEALCTCYMQARHFKYESSAEQAIWDMGGYYDYNLVRTAGGWRVHQYRLAITWELNRPSNISI
jgi:hypothetical protein